MRRFGAFFCLLFFSKTAISGSKDYPGGQNSTFKKRKKDGISQPVFLPVSVLALTTFTLVYFEVMQQTNTKVEHSWGFI